MKSIKGIYHDNIIELYEKPSNKAPTEVIVIFPDKNSKQIRKIGGIFKGQSIDYQNIKEDLKELSKNSESHLFEENEWIDM